MKDRWLGAKMMLAALIGSVLILRIVFHIGGLLLGALVMLMLILAFLFFLFYAGAKTMMDK